MATYEETSSALPEDDGSGLPIKRQLADVSVWFVRLRWLAAAGIFLGGIVAQSLGFNLHWVEGALVAAYLLAANLIFVLALRRESPREWPGSTLKFFNVGQVAVDWGAVIALIYLTGGMGSPCVFFFFFHLVMAAILQPTRNIYPASVIAALLLSGLFLLEAFELIPHRDFIPGVTVPYREPLYIVSTVSAFVISIFLTVFFAAWVSKLMARRMRQLAETTARLETTSARLHAIYGVIRLIGVNFVLSELLDAVVSQATRLWGIRSAFVALLDPQTRQYSFASVRELDPGNRPDTPRFLESPPFSEALKRGATISIPDLTNLGPQFDFPTLAWLAEQGKRSLMVVPLRVGRQVIGAFCLSARRADIFSDEDRRYFQIFADLVAIEIENVRANQILMNHARTRTWFYQRAAHDLRAPLSAIRSMLTLITDGYVEDLEEIRALVSRANARAEGLQGMIADLLLLAEDRMSELENRLEGVDVAALLRSVAELYEAEAIKKRITLRVDVPDGPVWVRATADGMERIFNNLVSNGVKYTPDAGRVDVHLALDGERVEISVSDTGIGIPEESRSAIFQEFFRAPNARKLTEMGTGLGLSITRKLVEEFQGEIRFAPGAAAGTVFTVRFPTGKAPADL